MILMVMVTQHVSNNVHACTHCRTYFYLRKYLNLKVKANDVVFCPVSNKPDAVMKFVLFALHMSPKTGHNYHILPGWQKTQRL